ncbi:MAG: NAD-dependent epimerase/dehydratase family protein [Halioglobus sp.]|nr:NAD-dependent epimerase/dehydratase family protein [Halioglobus sp.]
MRVMVTGGTGFLGYHTVQALLAAGHEVSLLVRSVDKMLRLFGDDRIGQVTRGDLNDKNRVLRALDGCDAVVHSAAMVSTSTHDADTIFKTNLEGTKLVIGEALDKQVEQVIHVSSVTALFDPEASRLDENSPPGPGISRSGYGRSKIACEIFARELQKQGEPVHITYPASIIGPDDPGLTEPHRGLIALLQGLLFVMPSGNQYVDVRDIARVHCLLLEQQPPAGRFPLGGTYLPWRDHARFLSKLTGRRLLSIPMPAALSLLTGRFTDRLARYLPFELPVTEEGMRYATGWVPVDNRHVEEKLDFSFRPLDETMRDTITWLNRAGHLPDRLAGKLAAA